MLECTSGNKAVEFLQLKVVSSNYNYPCAHCSNRRGLITFHVACFIQDKVGGRYVGPYAAWYCLTSELLLQQCI